MSRILDELLKISVDLPVTGRINLKDMSDKDLLIGEVAAQTGLDSKTIRYYEELGLIAKPRRKHTGYASAGYRLYSERDVERLRLIKGIRLLGLSLAEIRELLSHLDGPGARRHLNRTLQEKLAAIDAAIKELQLLRDRLERIRAVTAREMVEQTQNCCDPLCGPQICPPPLVSIGREARGQGKRGRNSDRRKEP